jgi:hypothetical protein
MILRRAACTVRAVARECLGAVRICAGPRSTLRLVGDVLLYRVLRVLRLPHENQARCIQLRTGEEVSYRLNRGDIQSIREVLLEEVYRLPFPLEPRVVVDLGANIGLTSLYFGRGGPEVLLAVEADTENATLARRNLDSPGARVVEAAIAHAMALLASFRAATPISELCQKPMTWAPRCR